VAFADIVGSKKGAYSSAQSAVFRLSIDHTKTLIVLNRPILSTSLTLTAESTSFLIEEALPGHVLSGDNLSYEVND
jgi:hypothetical protein